MPIIKRVKSVTDMNVFVGECYYLRNINTSMYFYDKNNNFLLFLILILFMMETFLWFLFPYYIQVKSLFTNDIKNDY